MSATVPQSTTTTSSSLSSRIAVPANLSSDRGPLAESLTQGLWRFPVLSTADTLNPSSSNKSTGPIKLARDHHSEPRTPASLASIIGVKKNISDISPHEFWNRVRGIDGKEIVLVINGDLIRDRIRNWSLPWYLPYFSPKPSADWGLSRSPRFLWSNELTMLVPTSPPSSKQHQNISTKRQPSQSEPAPSPLPRAPLHPTSNTASNLNSPSMKLPPPMTSHMSPGKGPTLPHFLYFQLLFRMGLTVVNFCIVGFRLSWR